MIVPGSASPLLTTTDGAYTISKSLRFRKSATAFLNRTPGSAGNRKTWTWSGWVKRGTLSDSEQALFHATSGNATGNLDYGTGIRFTADNTLQLYSFVNSGFDMSVVPTQVFRDPSAWYHIVFSVDTTQATSSNRVKIYINGSQVTAFGTATYPTLNYDTYVDSTNGHFIGKTVTDSSSIDYFDGYLADNYFIDGQALTPSSFGETDSVTGVWKPKQFSGTYGTNGFYLKFTDVATTSGSNAGLGKDFSGNGNYWNTNNISVTSGATYDSMKDVPTLTDTDTANYAVMNPLIKSSNTEHSEANLKLKRITSDGDTASVSTLAMASGKWYWEIKLDVLNTTGNTVVGIAKSNLQTTPTYAGANIVSFGHATTNQAYRYGTLLTNLASNMAQGDVLAFALDMDAGTLAYYKNNTLIYTATSVDTTIPHYAFWTSYSVNESSTFNFGQRPFTYTPPTGFKALNTYNLPDSTIVAGNKVIDATTYTGNGSTQTITNAGAFKPDLVWMKGRNYAVNNVLNDSVRGISKFLFSDSTSAELTNTGYGVTAFNSNGFTAVDDSAGAYGANGSSKTYVAWQWQAGQGTTSSNTSGSITSTVSVNASAGFSIVTYTGNGSAGATVGHGLGVAPAMMIVKNRSSGTTDSWGVYHQAISSTPANDYLFLNQTAAKGTNIVVWNNTAPTSSVFSIGTDNLVNGNTKSYVAYCWSEIAGFSKFGSFSGNGSSDGSFIYTGFKPKFLLIKRTDTSGYGWHLLDTSRNTYNVVGKVLIPNSSAAESDDAASYGTDFVSNGFKFRTAAAGVNGSGATYIFAAFSENPFKNALAA